jgi:hypothetical protein
VHRTNTRSYDRRGLRAGWTLIAVLAACGVAGQASAEEITFGGAITQSTQDGTGPAVNNPTLNGIKDGDFYTVTLDFPGSLTSPGAFDPLAGATLTFLDTAAGAGESAFDLISLSVLPDASFADISLLACLSTGGACDQGNELDANFEIPAVQLNSKTWNGQAISGLLPLDLLEDDGTTDIHGSVSAIAAVPEPTQIWLLGAVITGALWRSRGKKQ